MYSSLRCIHSSVCHCSDIPELESAGVGLLDTSCLARELCLFGSGNGVLPFRGPGWY